MFLTSVERLQAVKAASDAGREPEASNVSAFTSTAAAAATWTNGTIGATDTMYMTANGGTPSRNPTLGPPEDPAYPRDDFVHYDSGGRDIYEKALAHHLLADTAYGDKVVSLIDELVQLTTLGDNLTEGQSYNSGNQWVLHATTGLPLWIQAADLLSDYSGFTEAKQNTFKTWLATEIYKFASWASHNRKNNWGSSASLTCWMIAKYVNGYIATLTETVETGGNAVGSQYTQSPAAAMATHKQNQLDRMGLTVQMDAQCTDSGITTYGGIKEEVRRGSDSDCTLTSCYTIADTLDTTLRNYQVKQIQHLLFHAECMRNNGDEDLYRFLTGDIAAIHQAINFVIQNPTDPTDSVDWDSNQHGNLYVSNQFYRNPIMLTTAESNPGLPRGAELPFGRMTHHIRTSVRAGVTSDRRKSLFGALVS